MHLAERIRLVTELIALPDDVLVGAEAVGLIMDLSPLTVRQRRNATIPRPLAGLRVLRWRLGDVRQKLRELPLS